MLYSVFVVIILLLQPSVFLKYISTWSFFRLFIFWSQFFKPIDFLFDGPSDIIETDLIILSSWNVERCFMGLVAADWRFYHADFLFQSLYFLSFLFSLCLNFLKTIRLEQIVLNMMSSITGSATRVCTTLHSFPAASLTNTDRLQNFHGLILNWVVVALIAVFIESQEFGLIMSNANYFAGRWVAFRVCCTCHPIHRQQI